MRLNYVKARSLRIGLICHDSFGGSTRIATELAICLADMGHQIELFAYSVPFGEWKVRPGITLHTIRAERPNNLHPSSLYTNWSGSELEDFSNCIMQVITNKGLDILHFHYAVPFADVVAGIRARSVSKMPLIIGTLHGTDVIAFANHADAKTNQLAKNLNVLDALTTVSSSHARLAQETFHLAEQPIVIPNFVDTERFSPVGPNESAEYAEYDKSTKPKVIHISNFRTVKRIADVAQIFWGIWQQLGAELWLVGDGDALSSVKQVFRGHDIQNSIRYWGLQPDVGPILKQANLLLVTSQYESFCLSALEAMSCGVPVLATDVGGLPELISTGENGFLYPVGECDTAIELAIKLLAAPDRHRTIAKVARQGALSYAREHIIPQYEQLYTRLLTSGDF